MKWALLFLLTAFAIDDDLREQHQQRVKRIKDIQNSAPKDEQGLTPREEYGRIIYEIMTIRGESSIINYRDLVDEYVRTLPEKMNPEKIMEDIGWGKFHELMMKRHDDHLQEQLAKSQERIRSRTSDL